MTGTMDEDDDGDDESEGDEDEDAGDDNHSHHDFTMIFFPPRLMGWLHLSSGNCQKNREQLSQAIASSVQSYWEQMGKASRCAELKTASCNQGSWWSWRGSIIPHVLQSTGNQILITRDANWLWLKLSETQLNQNKKLFLTPKKTKYCRVDRDIIWDIPKELDHGHIVSHVLHFDYKIMLDFYSSIGESIYIYI